MGKSWAVSLLAGTIALVCAGTATAQLQVGPEGDLSDAGPSLLEGPAPVLSYDTQRGGWMAFWRSYAGDDEDPQWRLVSRYVNSEGRPNHDASSVFTYDPPVSAAYDPVADEHVLTTWDNFGMPARVRRFSSMGEASGGPWTLEDDAMFPVVALDPRTGAGIVAYVIQRDGPPDEDGFSTYDRGLWVQRLAAGGGLQGAPFRVSLEGNDVDFHRPAVAFNAARNEFAIAWRELRPGLFPLVGDIIAARVPATTGGPIGEPAAISDSQGPMIAQASGVRDGAATPVLEYDAVTGGFLAVWLGARGDVLESPYQIYGQRLDGELHEVGADDFRISSGPGLVGPSSYPDVVANDGMLVSWIRWVGDERQVVGTRVQGDTPAPADLLWANEDGLNASPRLAGPASGPVLLGMGVELSRVPDGPQVRLVGDGADPGTARVVSGPSATSPSRDAAFGLEPGRPDGGLQCRFDSEGWRSCGRSHELAGLPDGSHRLEVRAAGPQRWVQVAPTVANWRVEAAPPETRITKVPEPWQSSASFHVAADERAGFECRFDDGPWASCGGLSSTEGLAHASVADGVHRFEGRAIDDAGRRDPSPAIWVWTVDTDDPETVMDDGPSGFTPPPGTFWFHSDEANVRFECARESFSDEFFPCESGVPFATKDGNFRVRAVDAAGNRDETPGHWSWPADTTKPVVGFAGTNLDIPQDGVVATRDVKMKFADGTSGSAGTEYECRLDGAGWDRCRSPVGLEGLADGAHVFEVRATDRAGNVSSVAPLRFTVDTQRPSVYVLEKPRPRTLLRSARIEFAATTAATFTCAVDFGPAQPCSSPFVLNGLAVGLHIVQILPTGAGGWSPDRATSVEWRVESDPNAPPAAAPASSRAARAAAAVTPPPHPAFIYTPPKSTREDTAGFIWEWSETDDEVTSECRLDGADWYACDTPHTLRNVSDGTHRFEVRTVGSTGERSGIAAYEWTADTITARIVFGQLPGRRTNASPVTVEFSADRAGATLECRSADTDWQPCTSPYTAAGQPEGTYRFIVRAVNQGRIGPWRSVTWTVDRTPADTVIDSDRISAGMTTNRTDLDFAVRATGHAAEVFPDGSVDYVDDEFYSTRCRLDGGAWNWCSSTLVRNLADGVHVLEAYVTDSAGNPDPTPAQFVWTVDTGTADTAIDSGPAATEERRTATFTLRAIGAGQGFECRLDGGAWRACEATHTLTGVADGSHTFEARAVGRGSPDPTPASWLWTVDAEPTPVLVSGPPPHTADATARFQLGADDPGARIECALDGGAWQPCGPDAAFPGLADGDHTLGVRAVDGAGRSGVLSDAWRWSVDTRAPDTLLVSGPEELRRWRDAEVAFRSDETGTRYQCRLDGGAWATCASSHWVRGLTDATHTFETRAIDPAGNTDATPLSVSWRVDSTLPVAQLTAAPAIPTGTKRTSATFTATGNEPITTAECRVDAGAWVPCRDGVQLSAAAEGPHRAEARVVDTAGNVAYSLPLEWTRVRPLDTEIVRRPPAIDSSTSATFEYSAGTIRYVCSLDGGPWETCGSNSRTYTGLATGRHTFAVASIDGDGDQEPTPATWEWEVQPAAPETTIQEGPPATTTDRTARFVFTSSQPGSTFKCTLDGGPWTPCTTPHTVTGLADGAHRIGVAATGPNGKLDVSAAGWNWTVTAATTAAKGGRPAPTATPQVARGAADAVSRALSGRAGLKVLSGRRGVAVAGAPRELVVRVRARGRVVAAAKVRLKTTGTRRVALRQVRKLPRRARVTVSVTWRPASGERQTARLTTRVRRR